MFYNNFKIESILSILKTTGIWKDVKIYSDPDPTPDSKALKTHYTKFKMCLQKVL